jgi:cyclase
LVTSIDREGTGRGFDLELTRLVADSVPIPVIACGGAGRLSHIYDVAELGKADAVCLASVLHYGFLEHHNPDDIAGEGNTEYLKSRNAFSRVENATLPEIKEYLISRGIPCRPPDRQTAHV